MKQESTKPDYFVICQRGPNCENAHCRKPSCDQPNFSNRSDIVLGPNGKPVFLILASDSRARAHAICEEIRPRWINAAVAIGTITPDINLGGHRHEIMEILNPNPALAQPGMPPAAN
jgi:hypothetical protein